MHKPVFLLLCGLALLLTNCSGGSTSSPPHSSAENSTKTFQIGAFNVNTLGPTKMSKPTIVDHLVNIIRRYDLIIIQEVRDKSEQAIYDLQAALNQAGYPQYALLLSPRAGRYSYKEQYAYLYRSERITILDYFDYDDGEEPYHDQLEREPRIAYVDLAGTTFGIIPLHIDKDDVLNEVNHIPSLITETRKRFNDADVMVIGDLNTGCSYIRKQDWPQVILRNEADYVWLIDDHSDTTTSPNTHCAYDRIIINQALAQQFVEPEGRIFNFQSAYGLYDNVARQISDHYPVEIAITLPRY